MKTEEIVNNSLLSILNLISNNRSIRDSVTRSSINYYDIDLNGLENLKATDCNAYRDKTIEVMRYIASNYDVFKIIDEPFEGEVDEDYQELVFFNLELTPKFQSFYEHLKNQPTQGPQGEQPVISPNQISYNGKTYILSDTQTEIFKALYEEYKKDPTVYLEKSYILEEAGFHGELKDAFSKKQKNDGWLALKDFTEEDPTSHHRRFRFKIPK